jgi:hypothetical protein
VQRHEACSRKPVGFAPCKKMCMQLHSAKTHAPCNKMCMHTRQHGAIQFKNKTPVPGNVCVAAAAAPPTHSPSFRGPSVSPE